MKEFDHHEPCPSCGSSDNLGVWKDGNSYQKYCFGCGFMVGDSRKSVSDRLSSANWDNNNNDNNPILSLPSDFSFDIPQQALKWCAKYLTIEEVKRHKFGWSEYRKRLIFPIHDSYGNLLMWQGRYFGEQNGDKKIPKYFTQGPAEEVFHILDGPATSQEAEIVIVEDLISAIVVSRTRNAMPLWGSSCSKTRLARLSSLYYFLTIWLDSDKKKESIKIKQQAEQMFDTVDVIWTDLDPKEHLNVRNVS